MASNVTFYLDGLGDHLRGKQAAEIPVGKPLLGLIARIVVEGEGRQTGAQIRFLQKRLGKKALEFATIIRVTPEQVSWENNSNPPEPGAHKLIPLYLPSHRKLGAQDRQLPVLRRGSSTRGANRSSTS